MLYGLVLPTLLLIAPWLLVRFVFTTKQTAKLKYSANAIYLWLASGIWFVSQVVPSVPVSPQTDTFSMHLFGGVVATLLFIYAVKSYKIRFETWWQPWVGLFLFAGGLGVLNELFEFFLQSVGAPGVVGGDEWWDLTANTLGAFATYSTTFIANKLYARN